MNLLRRKTVKIQTLTNNGLEKSFVLSDKDLKPGAYVILRYDNNFYPGKIKNRARKGKYLVRAMSESGKIDWKWPGSEPKDEIMYDMSAIVEVIELPEKKNNTR